MISPLLWPAALVVILLTEIHPRRVLFTAAAFAALTAVLLLVFGDLGRATILATIVALLIAGASAVKHHHSGMKLAAGDLALTFAGTLPFMVRQYRRTALVTIVTATALLVAAAIAIAEVRDLPASLPVRLLAPLLTAGLTLVLYRAAGGAPAFRPDVTASARFFSFFAASLTDVASWWPVKGLRMLDLGDAPLPLAAPLAARSALLPDIIVIQHESVFDPRLYGLPVEPAIADFLAPPRAHSGRLHVDIYGGGSWQTEFSLLTGLSSASFGPDSYFLFKKGVGRFRHSLPSQLSALGYRAMLSTSCRKNFLNYDAFYAGLGVQERWFSDTFPAPFDLAAFELTNSDASFFDATEAAFHGSVERDPAPRFLMALTNFNHGPHEVRALPEGRHEDARSYALSTLAAPTYGEYYARLTETAESYARFRASLAARYPGRPMLIVRYGDHQPTMSRTIESAKGLEADDSRLFETFFAIEGVNFTPLPVETPARLDIAMLGTVALHAAGLPLDPVSATRLDLLAACGAGYFVASTERRTGFHRTLVDLGLIDLAAAARYPATLERRHDAL